MVVIATRYVFLCWSYDTSITWKILGTHCSIMANRLDYNIRVSKFKLQLHYYIHFQTNTLGKGMNYCISPALSSLVQLLFFYKDDPLNRSSWPIDWTPTGTGSQSCQSWPGSYGNGGEHCTP